MPRHKFHFDPIIDIQINLINSNYFGRDSTSSQLPRNPPKELRQHVLERRQMRNKEVIRGPGHAPPLFPNQPEFAVTWTRFPQDLSQYRGILPA